MWTSTLDLDPKRVLITQILKRFWRGACFSSFAPLRVENLPRQSLPSPSWVRVRNRLAGVCGSDLHLIYGDGDFRIAPAALSQHHRTYLGHEVVGDVIEIGEDVQQLKVGDRVVLQYGPNCLSAGLQPLCRSCASGNYNLCERGELPGPTPLGGGWSEEMLLHEQQLFRVPTELTDQQAVMLEPTAVALHAVLRWLPQPGDRILIIGAGTIGLLTLQLLQLLVPDLEISVLARHSFQVEQATRMGAAHIIYPQDSYHGVQNATKGQIFHGMLGNTMLMGGYDAIYDTVGSKDTLQNSLRWTRANGTVVLVGINLHLMNIDLTPVWYQEVNLIGAMGHGTEVWPLDSNKQNTTFNIVTALIKEGLLHPEQLITHYFALNNYRHALMTAIDKTESRAIKVIFDYSLQPASVVPNVRASAPKPRRTTTIDINDPLVDGEPVPLTEHSPVPSTSLPPIPDTPETQDEPLLPLPAPMYDEDMDDDDQTATALPVVKPSSAPLENTSEQTWWSSDDSSQIFASRDTTEKEIDELDEHSTIQHTEDVETPAESPQAIETLDTIEQPLVADEAPESIESEEESLSTDDLPADNQVIPEQNGDIDTFVHVGKHQNQEQLRLRGRKKHRNR